MHLAGAPHVLHTSIAASLAALTPPRRPRDAGHGAENNYVRSIQYAPDGSALLAVANDDVLRLFPGQPPLLAPALAVPMSECVYATAWYPHMRASEPATCCFLTSMRATPIHLLDAARGHSRATYTITDHIERVLGPLSLAFSADGTRIYGGVENAIHVFDTHRPGNVPLSVMRTTPTRRSVDGQKGIVAALAVDPSHAPVIAAGSYHGSIGLYHTETGELLHLMHGPGGAQRNGVTQVRFSPCGRYLIGAARMCHDITVWDVRGGTGSDGIVGSVKRPGRTNQRLAFDVSPDGAWLMSGDTAGAVHVFEMARIVAGMEGVLPTLALDGAHQDVVAGAAFHPTGLPIIATCSGQRKPLQLDLGSDTSDGEEGKGRVVDNSIKLWQWDQP